MANQQSMNDQLRVRRQKMQELRDEGVDPFGHRFERDFLNKELHDKFEDKTKEELIDLDVKATLPIRKRIVFFCERFCRTVRDRRASFWFFSAW